ncbi:MAG TPA: saccharopine dehydrogenase C-terminal domain-containing protein [Fimbriimonas sp.]
MDGSKTYFVVGAGMQGTAAAYDLARFGNAGRIVLTDIDGEAARKSADRVNRLSESNVCESLRLDASDVAAVAKAVGTADVVLSCVPYKLHATVEEGAFQAGVSVLDMGNDTDVTLKTLGRDQELRERGITFVPDTGLAPGLVNSLAVWFMEELDEVTDVRLFCGGLPQNPKPPFNYALRFSIEGLVGEYVDEAIAIRDHEVVRLETLAELETIEVPTLGVLEAFTTSSGTSTAPFTFRDRVRNYEYKTLRYPGHCALMRIFHDFGFWDEEKLEFPGGRVAPFEVFCRLMGEKLRDPEDRDLVVTHAIGRGVKEGAPSQMMATIIDYHDDATGFTAMERLTGFSTAIVAIEIANGRIRKGAVPYETAISGGTMLDALRKRGIDIQVEKEVGASDSR